MWQQDDLAWRGTVETALRAAGADARLRFLRATWRVAGGDASTEALPRLNGEIVAAPVSRCLTMLQFDVQLEPHRLVVRYLAPRRCIQSDAGRSARPSRRGSPAELGRLLQRSAEAIRIHPPSVRMAPGAGLGLIQSPFLPGKRGLLAHPLSLEVSYGVLDPAEVTLPHH